MLVCSFGARRHTLTFLQHCYNTCNESPQCNITQRVARWVFSVAPPTVQYLPSSLLQGFFDVLYSSRLWHQVQKRLLTRCRLFPLRQKTKVVLLRYTVKSQSVIRSSALIAPTYVFQPILDLICMTCSMMRPMVPPAVHWCTQHWARLHT